MNAESILIGLAWTLGVFAVAAALIWLIFRGVELEIVSGRQSRLAGIMWPSLYACVNAAIHAGDENRWSAAFWVVLAVACLFLTWREWRRERA